MNTDQDGRGEDVNLITQRVIGCVHVVSNTLGIGFVEKVYENALAHSLRKNGLRVAQQHPIEVTFDGILVGDFVADLLVQDTVLLGLKAVSTLTQEHLAQGLNYLRATGLPVCLLINFGTTKAQIKRLIPSVHWKPAMTAVSQHSR